MSLYRDSLATPRELPEAEVRVANAGHSARAWRSFFYAFFGYFALSLIVWSGIWTSHPSSVTTCGCGDGSLVTWFLAWPAYALTHGLSQFFSTFANTPRASTCWRTRVPPGSGSCLLPSRGSSVL